MVPSYPEVDLRVTNIKGELKGNKEIISRKAPVLEPAKPPKTKRRAKGSVPFHATTDWVTHLQEQVRAYDEARRLAIEEQARVAYTTATAQVTMNTGDTVAYRYYFPGEEIPNWGIPNENH